MSLFLKPLENITIDDISKFISEKHPENIRLEYKSGFSTSNPNLQIAKEVSAFANQQGGLLIYGVSEEEENTRRPNAVIGVEKKSNPRQRIQSVCIDHIYPPVIPEIQEYELPSDKDKVIILVRIPMSDTVPHTINERTGFYIRVQDRCDPREMTDEEIKFLLNKREKLIERREWLIKRSYERVFPPDVKRNYMLTPAILISIPLYPLSALVERSKLYDIYKQSELPVNQSFPLSLDGIKSASDSIYAYITNKDDDKVTVRKERYGELNIFGQISHFENAVHNFNSAEGIWLGYELRTLFMMVKFMGNVYKNLGFWGIIKFILRVENCRGVKLISPRYGWTHNEELTTMELDREIKIERECAVSDLLEEPDSFIENIFQEYLWCIGLGVHRANTMPGGIWLDNVKMDLYGKKQCPKCNKAEISNIDLVCRGCKKAS